MQHHHSFLSAALLPVLLLGCASQMERPVTENHLANVSALSTVAARRMVIVNTGFEKKPPYIASKFCAEPSPDISENIISSLNTKADASGTADTDASVLRIDASAKAELFKAFQNSGKTLLNRTQGTQFFRDGLFSLCNAHMNGAITDAQYHELYKNLVDSSVKLIEKEIPLIYGK